MDEMKLFERDLIKALLDMVYNDKLITSAEQRAIEKEYWTLAENKVEIKVGSYDSLYKDADKVRDAVFCVEQKISAKIEKDKKDKTSTHIVLFVNSVPVSTLRVFEENGEYIFGRVATLLNCRGKGYGKEVMLALHKYAKEKGIDKLTCHAQETAKDFYLKLGYKIEGKPFYEAGIKHYMMSYAVL